MEQYGILIVDDSAFMRRAISLLVERDPQLFVVGIARNGQEAVEKVERFKPDLVTMDIEMPEMDGIEALQIIMRRFPVPVVMLSTQTGDGTKETLRALELGAVDFFLKGELLQESLPEEQVRDFLLRLKQAVRANIQRRGGDSGQGVTASAAPAGTAETPSAASLQQQHAAERVLRAVSGSRRTELLFIGTSTGGPSALQSILPRFPADFPLPIFVVQHMPPGFTKPLADRFNTICPLEVKEAEEGEVVRPGHIYIAPSGFQTVFAKLADGQVKLRIEETSDIPTLYKPSVDVALHSAAPLYKEGLLSVVLTGMGVDGLSGCYEVKKHGGRVLVEAEGSCIVYGMPKAIYDAGLADRQALLPHMYSLISSYC